MTVDLDQVTCQSAFDLAPERRRRLGQAATPVDRPGIDVVDLDDVLFLPHVLEPGQSLTLVHDRIVPLESVLDCWSVEFFHNSRRNNPEFRAKYENTFEPNVVDDRVCILGNLFSRNFGHWTEELLKVAVLEKSAERCSYVIPTLPSFAADFLRLLGVHERRIRCTDRPSRFTRAAFTTAVSHQNISAYPQVLSCLRDLVERSLGAGSSAHGPRLWAERAALLRNGGVVTNREEVYRLLETYDFDVVDMATMTVEDQLRTVRHASIFAGPHGAQFVHAQFMPAQSIVVECFSPIHVNPSVLQICRVLQQSYHQVVARSHLLRPYAHGRDCEIDCEHLRFVLDTVL
jgi:capsular polysaccharide biosynthesis protein